MSNLNQYRQLERAWRLVRLDGQLTMAEEVLWTETIGNVWRTLTEEERDAVEEHSLRDLAEDMVEAADRIGPLKVLNVRDIVQRNKEE